MEKGKTRKNLTQEPSSASIEPTGETAKGEVLTLEQVQTRIEKINSHINNLKLFVVAFCLLTVLLNTYHINRLKNFSSNLGTLMKTHSGALTQLNVLSQIK